MSDEAIPDPKVVEVVKQLEAEGFDSSHLDGAVQDAASERASGVNNDGLYAQVHYLLRGSDHSWKPADVIDAARQHKADDTDDDDFESSQDHWSSPNGCHDDCPACAEEEANRQRAATGIPKFVLSRDGKLKGEVTGTRPCRLEGCTGEALCVKWPDGKRTYPCGKGTEATDEPDTVKIG
jgi:hypothetical protein